MTDHPGGFGVVVGQDRHLTGGDIEVRQVDDHIAPAGHGQIVVFDPFIFLDCCHTCPP
jgi:hypothetical protein